MTRPVTRGRGGYYVTGLSPLRELRLLKMAYKGNFHHKRFYSQYCYLIGKGYVQWALGHAFITAEGIDRMFELDKG